MRWSNLFLAFILAGNISFSQETGKENLGPNINTPFDDTKPLISPDGQTLFFARQNAPDNVKGIRDEQDIYIAVRDSSRGWSPAVNIGVPLNDKYPNGVSAVSPDGNLLLVIGYYDETTVTEGASISKKTKGGWSPPKGINIKNFINRGPFIDYYLSNNEEQILIAVEGERTEGLQDLYVSFRIDESNWSSPINLGPTINTPGAEFSPFLAADDKTLFFASDGHPGKGGSDIFYSKRLDNTWQHWSEPKNIGHPVNTDGFEAYYSLPASGAYAYFVSDKDGTEGSKDIFRVPIPEEFMPEPVLLVKGMVLNEPNYNPLETEIVFKLYPEDIEAGVAKSSPVKGEYEVVLPFGHIYEYIAEVEGYLAVYQYEDTREISSYTEIENNLYLVPIDSGQSITIHDFVFEDNTSILKPESKQEVKRIVDKLSSYEQLKLSITAHAFDLSNESDNLKLSLGRAERIKQELVKDGIPESNITVDGKGAEQPFDNYDNIDIRPGLNPNNRIVLTITDL
jgi:outer membrane protein OmpA-like peptidoglycan-associated protein